MIEVEFFKWDVSFTQSVLKKIKTTVIVDI
jgi:hypothetical protein